MGFSSVVNMYEAETRDNNNNSDIRVFLSETEKIPDQRIKFISMNEADT